MMITAGEAGHCDAVATSTVLSDDVAAPAVAVAPTTLVHTARRTHEVRGGRLDVVNAEPEVIETPLPEIRRVRNQDRPLGSDRTGAAGSRNEDPPHRARA